jgi:hypothetical protein
LRWRGQSPIPHPSVIVNVYSNAVVGSPPVVIYVDATGYSRAVQCRHRPLGEEVGEEGDDVVPSIRNESIQRRKKNVHGRR